MESGPFSLVFFERRHEVLMLIGELGGVAATLTWINARQINYLILHLRQVERSILRTYYFDIKDGVVPSANSGNGFGVRLREVAMTADQARLRLKIMLGLSSAHTKGFPMKISFALLIAATLLVFQMPARAGTTYPTQWCRVYDDTSFIQIPGQCGTVVPHYPRKLFLQASRRLSYYYYRSYDYCPY